jgi:hypothetical protein
VATLASLRTALASRLGDSGFSVWSSDELDAFLSTGITALYPYWYRRKVETTEAGNGPIQILPAGCRNLYMVGHRRSTSTRVRPLRNWEEGDGEAFVAKTGITGDTLLWAWTEGWEAPDLEDDPLGIPVESEEAVLLRAQISALEKLLSDRVSVEKYHALTVRQAVTEDDLSLIIDALHQSLREHYERAMPLPEVKK